MHMITTAQCAADASTAVQGARDSHPIDHAELPHAVAACYHTPRQLLLHLQEAHKAILFNYRHRNQRTYLQELRC
jgi:hypothetical protein